MLKLATVLSHVLVTASMSSSPSVGDSATYLLNKSLSSRVISSGKVTAVLSEYDDNTQQFTLDLACDFKVLGGGFGGKQKEEVPQEILNGEWLQFLRDQGTVELPALKVKHQGYEDITLMGGQRLVKADKIFLYDIKTDDNSPDEGCFQQTLEAIGLAPFEVTNLTIKSWVAPNALPIGGLGRVTVEGRQSGVNFKVTLDKVPSRP